MTAFDNIRFYSRDNVPIEECIKILWASQDLMVPAVSPDDLSAFVDMVKGIRGKSEYPDDDTLTLGDIRKVRDIIIRDCGKPRKDIFGALLRDVLKVQEQQPPQDLETALEARERQSLRDSKAERVLKLVLELLLFIRVDCPDLRRTYPQPDCVTLFEGQRIKDMLNQLQGSRSVLTRTPSSDTVVFPRWLNVVDLEKKTGLGIAWVDHITDHLVIYNGKLNLFKNMEALKCINSSELLYAMGERSFLLVSLLTKYLVVINF